MSTNITKKETWIDAAVALLPTRAWSVPSHARQYAESLYETFVEEDDPDCTPEEALREDMSYWGN